MGLNLNVLDLFSGIGGFSLGLERAGLRTVAFCEIDPFCRRVLARHWPAVPCYNDVRTLTAGRLAADGIRIDAIAGGFPCQDISTAGNGIGIGGARSGLWKEYARIIGELRPGNVIVENVAALLGRGLGVVLGDLAALGYDAWWDCIPASAAGAHHIRDRIWIVANPRGEQHQGRCYALGRSIAAQLHEANSAGSYAEDNAKVRTGTGWNISARAWRIEPSVGRVAHGIPGRVDRLRGLGNAVVPQIPEIIGRAILAAEKS